jgi:pimeloyl-ACP methyl ester carboxylesterase
MDPAMEQKLPKCTVYYEEIGEGRPILVLHGGYLNHRHMVDALEPLFADRHGWKRIYIDIPGHGQSPVDPSISNHDEVLDLILSFVDEVLPGQGFAVAGESRGGYLARGIVRRRPDLVDGALFIVPGRYAVAAKGSVPPHVTLTRADELIATLQPHEVGRFNRLVVQSAEILEKIRRHKIPAAALADQDHQEKINANYEYAFDVDAPDKPFSKPVLFLLGRQDSEVGYQDALKAIECFPRATFAILDKAGHSLSWEQPTLFQALAGEWLQRVEVSDGDSPR